MYVRVQWVMETPEFIMLKVDKKNNTLIVIH